MDLTSFTCGSNLPSFRDNSQGSSCAGFTMEVCNASSWFMTFIVQKLHGKNQNMHKIGDKCFTRATCTLTACIPVSATATEWHWELKVLCITQGLVCSLSKGLRQKNLRGRVLCPLLSRWSHFWPGQDMQDLRKHPQRANPVERKGPPPWGKTRSILKRIVYNHAQNP